MKEIIIIKKIVFFFKYLNIVFFFNLESKSTLKDKSRQSPNNNSGTAVKLRAFVTNE